MLRLGCAVVIGLMTRRAIAASRAECRADVAVIARELRVNAAQRERGHGGVIPRHRGPRCRSMTVLAFIAETRVIAVVLAADPVTVVAARGRSLDHVVEVARAARRDQVPPLEREESSLVEAPRNARPRDLDLMAVRAHCSELPGVRIGMTRRARRRQSRKAHRRTAARGERSLL